MREALPAGTPFSSHMETGGGRAARRAPRPLGPAECWGPPEAPLNKPLSLALNSHSLTITPDAEQKPKARPRLKITPGAISKLQEGAVLATGARLCLSNWQEPTRGTSLQKQDRGRKNVLKPSGGEGRGGEGRGAAQGRLEGPRVSQGLEASQARTRLSQLGPLLHQQYTDITPPPHHSPVT